MKRKKITKAESDDLYKTMKFIHNIFTKLKIPYFIVGGTLLGAVRHGGLIPWDDDGDIAVFEKDIPKLTKLAKKLNKGKRYRMHINEDDIEHHDHPNKKSPVCIKKKVCTLYIESTKPESLSVDIFIMKIVGNRIRYSDPGWEADDAGGIKCGFRKDMTLPLVPIRLGNFYVYAPNNPVEHLNRCYGHDWNNKSRITFDHNSGKWIKDKPQDIPVKDFLPLKPPRSTCSSNIPPVNLCKN